MIREPEFFVDMGLTNIVILFVKKAQYIKKTYILTNISIYYYYYYISRSAIFVLLICYRTFFLINKNDNILFLYFVYLVSFKVKGLHLHLHLVI